MGFSSWLGVFALLVIIGFVLDREIYFYEGVHLGPGIQAWLYDRWSRKYDEGKRESQQRDDEMLAQPLLDILKNVPQPFVLDFATGTGRLSYALLSRPEFKGHIIALDLSKGMLEQAASKLNFRAPGGSVEILRYQSLPLPFPDLTFDAVCALEVLELFPNMDEPLAEFARILRPGGILLTSRGTERSGRKAKVKSRMEIGLLLSGYEFENLEISTWWKLFDRVFAVKKGRLSPGGMQKLSDVLRCPSCGKTRWAREDEALKCLNCGNELSITKEGIVLD